MTESKFAIPWEWQDSLEPVHVADARTDAEIIQDLNTFRPVTGEKNIWGFWDKGVAKMPAWCQRNVAGWVRLCSPEWQVRIIDKNPESPNYALKHLPRDLFPEAFVTNKLGGQFVGQNSADLVRTAAISAHGGIFLDVSVLLNTHVNEICWNQIGDDSNPKKIAVPLEHGTMTINYFLAAKKNDPMITAWHKLFVHLWVNKDSTDGILKHPLIESLNFPFDKLWGETTTSWELQVDPLVLLEYMAQMMCWQRLIQLRPVGGFDYAAYWRNNVLTLDSVSNFRPVAQIPGISDNGIDHFDLLRTRLDADPNSEQYKKASRLVWTVLARSSGIVTSRGHGFVNVAMLGNLWDAGGSTDCAEGTFAELLRWGTTHTAQKTYKPKYKQAAEPYQTLQKDVLEV